MKLATSTGDFWKHSVSSEESIRLIRDAGFCYLDIGYKGDFTFDALNVLRAAKDGRQPRQRFERDTRLANPSLEMQIDMERLLYRVGKHALSAYGCFEE
jgi:hypothetical protein